MMAWVLLTLCLEGEPKNRMQWAESADAWLRLLYLLGFYLFRHPHLHFQLIRGGGGEGGARRRPP